MSQTEMARRFDLSPSRIYLIERQDAADKSLAERRTSYGRRFVLLMTLTGGGRWKT